MLVNEARKKCRTKLEEEVVGRKRLGKKGTLGVAESFRTQDRKVPQGWPGGMETEGPDRL